MLLGRLFETKLLAAVKNHTPNTQNRADTLPKKKSTHTAPIYQSASAAMMLYARFYDFPVAAGDKTSLPVTLAQDHPFATLV